MNPRDITTIPALAPLVQELPAFAAELRYLKESSVDVHRSATQRWLDAKKLSTYLNCYAFANDHARRVEP